MRVQFRFMHLLPAAVIVVAICARGMISSELPLLQRVVRSLSASFLAVVLYCAILIITKRYLPELFGGYSQNKVGKGDYPVGQRIDVTVGSEGKRSWVKWKRMEKPRASSSVSSSPSANSVPSREMPISDSPNRQPLAATATQHSSHATDGTPADAHGHAMVRAATEDPKRVAAILNDLMSGNTPQGLKK